VLGVLVIWEAGTRMLEVPAFLLPPPSDIAVSFIANAPLLLFHGWITTAEILLGFALSIVVGIPLALAIFLWPTFSRSVLPLLVSSQAMPKVAVAPLFLVWFGFGLLPKVLIAFLIAFFPVVISTAVGLASIEPEKIYLARSMGFGATATFFKFRLPNALPAIFGGLKISITLAVVGAVVGEFVGGDVGLGYLLRAHLHDALQGEQLLVEIVGNAIDERILLPDHHIELLCVEGDERGRANRQDRDQEQQRSDARGPRRERPASRLAHQSEQTLGTVELHPADRL